MKVWFPFVFGMLLVPAARDAGAAFGQVSTQVYSGFAFEHSRHHFLTSGIDVFVESPGLVYIPAFSYADITVGLVENTSSPAIYSGVPVTESLHATLTGKIHRYTLAQKVEFFRTDGWNLATTFVGTIERARFSRTEVYSYDPRPAPSGWDTTLTSSRSSVNGFVTGGAEVSRFIDLHKAGTGALVFSDFQRSPVWQVYCFLHTNPQRRLTFKGVTGVVIENKAMFLSKLSVGWRATIDLELITTVSYSRTSFVYDIDERFWSFYREKDQFQAGVLGAYDVGRSLRVFAGARIERNDRFTLINIKAGVYYRPI